MKVSENLLEIVGNTPLIELSGIDSGISSDLYAKLEYANPTGSVKDRVSVYIIDWPPGSVNSGRGSPSVNLR